MEIAITIILTTITIISILTIITLIIITINDNHYCCFHYYNCYYYCYYYYYCYLKVRVTRYGAAHYTARDCAARSIKVGREVVAVCVCVLTPGCIISSISISSITPIIMGNCIIIMYISIIYSIIMDGMRAAHYFFMGRTPR